MGCHSITRILLAPNQGSLTVGQYPFILLGGERHGERKVFSQEHNTVAWPGLMNPGLSIQSLTLELQATAFPTVNSELKCRDEPVLSSHPQGICGWPLYMSASHRSHGIGVF